MTYRELELQVLELVPKKTNENKILELIDKVNLITEIIKKRKSNDS